MYFITIAEWISSYGLFCWPSLIYYLKIILGIIWYNIHAQLLLYTILIHVSNNYVHAHLVYTGVYIGHTHRSIQGRVLMGMNDVTMLSSD